ncbi:MAG: DNA polymerase III subunit delta [Acidobacteriota bacterium]
MATGRTKKKIDGISYDDLRKQIKAGHLESLYLFVGEEDYFQDRAVTLLKNSLDEGMRLFNFNSFTVGESVGGNRTTITQAIDNANQLPMMANRRITIIREFDKLKEEELDFVLDYLKHPSPTTTVVFRAVSLDQRRKITAALMKSCTVVTFDKLTDAEASRKAEEYLRWRGCRIEPAALSHLINLVGTHMGRLVNELEKLAAYAEGGFINNAAIQELVPRAREHSSFELWDAIMDRDRKRGLRLMHRLLDDKTEPLAIVGALGGLYRRMLSAKDLIARHAAFEDVAKATGQYGVRAKEFITKLNRMSRDSIVYGIRRIAQVDLAIKSSEATPRLQLEFLIAELTMPEKSRMI